MREMKLSKIRMQGFKIHIAEKELVFQHNTNVYADNGKGKTTIGDAVAWCFLGTDVNGTENVATKLINNASKDMEVSIEFEYEGKEHSLTRMKKGAKTTIILDGISSDQLEIMNFIKHKELFLSIFNPMYFSSLAPKIQKEILQKYLGEISTDEVLASMGIEGKRLIEDNFKDAKIYITRKRNSLQDFNDRENFLKGFITAKKTTIEVQPASTLSEDRDKEYLQLQAELEEVEGKPLYLHDISDQIKQKEALNKQIVELETQYNNLKNTPILVEEKKRLESKKDSKALLLDRHRLLKQSLADVQKIACPNCGTEIETQPEHVANLETKLKEVIEEGKQVAEEIKSLEEQIEAKAAQHFQQLDEELEAIGKQIEQMYAQSKDLDITQLETQNNIHRNEILLRRKSIQDKINQIISEKQKAKAENAQREVLIQQAKTVEREVADAQKELDAIEPEREQIKNQIDLANKFNSKRLQMQSAHIAQYLDKVSIQLEKIVKSTGEVKDDFKIQYEGKDFNLLSTSERIKAGLEIGNLLSSFSEEAYPVFVDNAESITHIPGMETQVIAAYVKEGQELNVD